MPRRSGFPGWMRWSPEDGEGGLRRVLLPRPLVRRKATIKSTRAMRYSALVKPERDSKAKRSFLIIKHRKSADCKSKHLPTSTSKPRGAVLDASASSYLPRSIRRTCSVGRLQVKKARRDKSRKIIRNFPKPIAFRRNLWYNIAKEDEFRLPSYHKGVLENEG